MSNQEQLEEKAEIKLNTESENNEMNKESEIKQNTESENNDAEKKNNSENKKNNSENKKNNELDKESENNDNEQKNNSENKQNNFDNESEKIIEKQLNFYFSNQNYHKDNFLRTTCEQENGITIQKLLTFQKLKNLNISEKEIKNVIKKLKFIKLTDEDKIIKIKDKIYEEYIKRNFDDFMIIISDLDINLSLDEIEKELKKYLKPTFIRMKRNGKKEFCGSVMVELDSVEEVEEALKLEIPYFSANKNKELDQPGENDKKNPSKKQKLNFLKISKKSEIQKMNAKKNFQKTKRENFSNLNKNKLFKYETKQNLEIIDIKKKLKNVAFVDLKKMVLRFKEAKENEVIEVDDDFKLRRLNDEEFRKYVDEMNFKEKTKKSEK